jgi:hypothetical protein
VLSTFTPINKTKLMESRLELWAKVFEASAESLIVMDATCASSPSTRPSAAIRCTTWWS